MEEPKKDDTPYEFQKYHEPKWYETYWIECLTGILGLIGMNLIFFAGTYTESNTIDPTRAGQLGDFVGGYIGTIFSLLSIVLLVITLKRQIATSSIEKFETKYFELIKMHRDNVSEIRIGEDVGKKIFVSLIREFRSIHRIAKEITAKLQLPYSKEQLFEISYYALFFGVGPNSSRMLKGALKQFNTEFVKQFVEQLDDDSVKREVKEKRKFNYTPFEGHQSRLGHYYRHLYQMLTYIDNQKIRIDKYEFAKTLRAQLTTHEQALLFISCFTPIGKVWWDNGLFLRYKFIQNIPYGFFDEGEEIELVKRFPSDYFEWQERKDKSEAESLQPS
jgi:hypothetical protein